MALLREALIPLVLLVFASFYWWSTSALPAASTVFPYVVMGFMAATGLAIIFKEVISPRNRETDAPLVTWRAPAMLAMSAGFITLFVYFGFVPASLIFLFTTYIVLGTRPLLAGIVAVALTAGYYLLFAILIGMNL